MYSDMEDSGDGYTLVAWCLLILKMFIMLLVACYMFHHEFSNFLNSIQVTNLTLPCYFLLNPRKFRIWLNLGNQLKNDFFLLNMIFIFRFVRTVSNISLSRLLNALLLIWIFGLSKPWAKLTFVVIMMAYITGIIWLWKANWWKLPKW